MSSSLATSAPTRKPRDGELRRVAFVGERDRLDGCLPDRIPGLAMLRLDLSQTDRQEMLPAVERFAADAVIVIDPLALPTQTLERLGSLPALTLGLLVDGLPEDDDHAAKAIGTLDRVASLDPALSGAPIGCSFVWRAMPPPVSDALFGQAQRLRRAPRAMSIGRSTEYREAMLMPSKHHHDLLQVIHGVTGEDLAQMLRQYDVGVHLAPRAGGSFGAQAAIHLAAGQLLLTDRLLPAHGLERGIDYLEIDSPEDLEWKLGRLARFPEMYHSLRVRGRMKAEQFRASRVFPRVIYDLFADVAAFGRSAPPPAGAD